MKICPTCSREWSDEAKFCGSCGTDLSNVPVVGAQEVAVVEEAVSDTATPEVAVAEVTDGVPVPEAAPVESAAFVAAEAVQGDAFAPAESPVAPAENPMPAQDEMPVVVEETVVETAVPQPAVSQAEPSPAAFQQSAPQQAPQQVAAGAQAAFSAATANAADISANLKEKMAAFTGTNVDDLVTYTNFDPDAITLDNATDEAVKGAIALITGRQWNEYEAEYEAEEQAAFASIQNEGQEFVEAEMMSIEIPEDADRVVNEQLMGALPDWDMLPPMEAVVR